MIDERERHAAIGHLLRIEFRLRYLEQRLDSNDTSERNRYHHANELAALEFILGVVADRDPQYVELLDLAAHRADEIEETRRANRVGVASNATHGNGGAA